MSTPLGIFLVTPDRARKRRARTALSRRRAFVTTEEAALHRCASSPPATVIMALVSPGPNGLQVLARLHARCPTPPVSLIDDSNGQRMGAKGLAAGAVAVFQSAQAGVWAVPLVNDLSALNPEGQESAWMGGPPPQEWAYLLLHHNNGRLQEITADSELQAHALTGEGDRSGGRTFDAQGARAPAAVVVRPTIMTPV